MLLFVVTSTRSLAIDISGFGYSLQVVFTGYTNTATLTNFPALVVLNSGISGFGYAQFQSPAGGDLLFTDAQSNELNYEVETWNTNGSSYLWVQVPRLTNGSVIRAFWGQTGLTAPAYRSNGATWNDGNFVGVWHMQTNYVTDSSGKGHNATLIDNPAAVTAATGVVGSGQSYALSGSGGRTVVDDIELTNQTLSAWVQVSDSSNWGVFMAKDDGQTFFWNQGTTLRFETIPYGGDTTANIASSGGYSSWIYFVATVNGTTQSIYTNGVLAANWTKQAPVATSATWDIGGGPFNRPLNGKLDECRAERAARPAAWIWACWKNQLAPGQFETVGPVVPLVPSLVVNSPVATAVTTNSASLGATVPSADGVPVTSWGTFWDTTPAPAANAQVVIGSTNAPFSFSLPYSGFSAGAHYYFRAWASNSVSGLRYSPDGEFYAEPDPVTNLIVSAASGFQLNLSWTPSPTASGYLVVMQPGSPVGASPQDGVTYSASATFGQGSDLGGGQYVVYAGAETNLIVHGLLPYSVYYATVYAYSGSGSLINYRQDSTVTGLYVPASFAKLQAVQVDPSTPLTNYTSLGEWNTNGNFENWSSNQISSATVSGGVLTGVAGGSDPQISLLNFTNGPDLDLAFNDHIDLRLQVPAGFTGNVQLYYGVTNTPGISAARMFAIVNTNIPQDGAFHVYRIFIGPQVYWRGNLRDLRVDPLGTSASAGQTFAIDYLRVGDLTGDIYLPRYSVNCPAAGANDTANNQPVSDLSSKHFRVVWDNWDVTNFPTFWNANLPHGTLRNLEEVWKNHIWQLGFIEPTQSWTPANRNGKKYKVNLTMFYGGYWSGGDVNNFGWLNITPDGLRVDPPTWVPPHEFGHVCQIHQNQTGNGAQNVDGQFWESHANYCRERWINYYAPYLPGWTDAQSGLNPNYSYLSHFWIGHGRDYYLCWPIYLYFDENPDNLPDLGEGFTAKIWQTEPSGEYFWTTAQHLMPHISLQDVIGYMARRNVMWDYSHRTALQSAENLGDSEILQRWVYGELRQRPDDPTWWQVPMEFAPQQTGYKVHQLIPQDAGVGRVVSVNFHGLPYSGGVRIADWRASFVVVSDSGAVRYSNLWNAGTNSVTLAANENTLYLVVAGTPNQFLSESIDDLAQPYQSAPSKVRFPYEIQITGATPKETSAASTAGLVQHSNGGGWKSTTATVDTTAYVGPNARVLGTAQVRSNARIEDYAIIEGSAQVLSNAVVSGHALVRNSAIVRDNAKVRDYATIIDNSVVAGNARVLQHGQLTAGSIAQNWATVKGSCSTWHDNNVTTGPQAWNDAVLDGDFSTAQSVSNGFQFGFEEYNPGPLQWITNRTAPRRLFADYEFTSAHNSLAKDFYGVTDGYLQGSPTWISSDGTRSGFLTFNGTNQCVILDRSLSDLPEISVTAWIKWSGGAPNQPVWFFGAATNKCMFFTPDDGTSHAKFVIRTNGVEQTLSAPAALTTGVWTHVTVTLSNSAVGRLYVNGVLQQQGSITIAPDRLNAPNTSTNLQQNYLARGGDATQPFFNGAVDSFKIYSGALTNGEITAMQAANVTPTLAANWNYVFNAGVTRYITNSASDPDQPWQTLTFTLLTAPGGMAINANSGVLTWRPAVAQANTTNLVTVKVADNGTPSLSATQSFLVAVSPFTLPALTAVSVAGGKFSFQVSGDFGPDYTVQSSTNLMNWSSLFITNSASFNWSDPSPPLQPVGFYRVLVSP